MSGHLPHIAPRTAFAPFEKGGHGGFALDLDLLKNVKSKSPSAPLLRRGKNSKANMGWGMFTESTAFAPFEKGGHGGFALDLGSLKNVKGKSPSIPLLGRGKKTVVAVGLNVAEIGA